MKFIKQAIKTEINFALARIRCHLLSFRSHDLYIKRYIKIPRVDSKQKVVVTLTTIPERIDKITVTLNSLLDQTRSPDAIYLAIPKISRITNKPYPVPGWLKNHPIIKILYCDKDYGPATKLIPAFLKYKDKPDTKIIVVDDDLIYPVFLIEHLCFYSEKYPEIALGNRGVILSKLVNRFCVDQVINFNSLSNIVNVDILRGESGFLVKPKFFNKDLFVISGQPRSIFFEDDVFFSGILAKNGIQRFCPPSSFLKKGKAGLLRTTPISIKNISRVTRSLCENENKGLGNFIESSEYFSSYW